MLGFQALGKIAIAELSTESAAISASGAFVFTGNAALFSATRGSAPGEFTLSGQAASRVVSMRASVGSFVETGISSNLARGRRLVALPSITTSSGHFLFAPLGEFALGGGSVGSQSTTFAFLGNNINFNIDNPLVAGLGSFVLTFIDGALIAIVRPSSVRIFPRVAFAMRGRGRGGGVVAKVSSGTSVRARAFGG
jgi:hypothetical protein